MHCMPTRAFLMGPAVIGILAAFTDVQISLAGGERAGEQAPIELVVDCPAHSAEEVERQTTLPLESALADLPHLRRMRTLSAPGRTHVALFFEPAAPMAEMRRKVAKRIQRVKDLPRHLNCGQLQLFFGTEMSEQSALAHLQFLGQAADGETLQAFQGGQVDGHVEDALARTSAFGRTKLCGPWRSS